MHETSRENFHAEWLYKLTIPAAQVLVEYVGCSKHVTDSFRAGQIPLADILIE